MKRVRKSVITSGVCFSLCIGSVFQSSCYAMGKGDPNRNENPDSPPSSHVSRAKPKNSASSSQNRRWSLLEKITFGLTLSALPSLVSGASSPHSSSLDIPEPLHSLNPSPAPLTLSSPPDFSQMSREDLEKFALGLHHQQQNLVTENSVLKQMASGMSPEEQSVSLILSTPLTTTHTYMIRALDLMEENKALSFDEALERVEEGIPPMTLGEVLRDETVSDSTARKVFRGLITGLNEEDTLDLARYRFSDLQLDKRVKTCISDFLLRSYHLTKVLYPTGSLTDYLIRKFTEERTGSFAWKIKGDQFRYILF